MKRSAISLCIAASTCFCFVGHSSAEEINSSEFYLLGEIGALSTQDSGAETLTFSNSAVVNTNNETLGLAGMVGIGLGKRFSENLRGDLSLNGRFGMDWDTISPANTPVGIFKAPIDSYSIMANVNWDINQIKLKNVTLTPYLSGGVGIALNTTRALTIMQGAITLNNVDGATNNDFAYQIGGGVGVELSEKLDLDFGYRYIDLGEFKTGTNGDIINLNAPVKGDITAHEFKIGLRVSF